jgi:secreted trypsin-like serine protease
MLRRLLPAVVLIAALALQAGPAGAITYGEPDGNAHPNVGALIVDFAGDDEGPVHICSGTLIDEDLFLTAAHCTSFLTPLDRVYVSFATDVDPIPKRLLPGTAISHPDFGHDQSNSFDIAVVDLNRDVTGLTPAAITEVGLLDRLDEAGTLASTRFTAVGYGVHEPTKGGGPPQFPYDGMRWRSVSTFNALTTAWLRLSQNANTSEGGTCFGDSGGPNFLGAGQSETDIIAAITISGDAMCRSTNVTYRLDTPWVHEFLGRFLD